VEGDRNLDSGISRMNDNTTDPNRLQLLRISQKHRGWINRIAWSPDGTRLASACNDNVAGEMPRCARYGWQVSDRS
jgi:WD40 repeat protein